MTMRRFISPLLLLLSGFALTSACGGAAEKPGGDGDGDGTYVVGTGSLSGNGETEGSGGGSVTGGGDGDAAGGGGTVGTACTPFAARLCDNVVGDESCTGHQVCDEDGSGWSSCVCRSVEIENAGGAGGAGTGDGEPRCPDARACGGLVAGQWVVRSSCLSVSGPLDVVSLGIGCVAADLAGALEVRGRVSLLDDGLIIDETVTAGHVAIGFDRTCRDISGTVVTCEQFGGPLESLGFSEVTCLDGLDGGCACVALVDQAGGLGHIDPQGVPGGTYLASGSELVFESAQYTYSYCALENSLTVTPTGMSKLGELNGTVVFERAP
jgi:hypothetical protein